MADSAINLYIKLGKDQQPENTFLQSPRKMHDRGSHDRFCTEPVRRYNVIITTFKKLQLPYKNKRMASKQGGGIYHRQPISLSPVCAVVVGGRQAGSGRLEFGLSMAWFMNISNRSAAAWTVAPQKCNVRFVRENRPSSATCAKSKVSKVMPAMLKQL